MLKLVLSLIFGGAIVACKQNNKASFQAKDGKHDERPTVPSTNDLSVPWAADVNFDFIKPDDVEIDKNLTPKTSKDVQAMMADGPSFYYHESADEENDEKNCLQKIFERMKIKAAKTWSTVQLRLTKDENLDFAKCLSDKQITFKNVKYSLELAHACEGGDMSILNSKSADNMSKFRCKNGKFLYALIQRFDFLMIAKTDGQTFEIETESIASRSMVDGKPCSGEISDKVITWDDGCQNLVTSRITSRVDGKPSPKDNRRSAELNVFHKIVGALNTSQRPRWYESGTMELFLDNWKGEVKYASFDQAPSYTLTSDKGEKLSGTVGSGKQRRSARELALTEDPLMADQLIEHKFRHLQGMIELSLSRW